MGVYRRYCLIFSAALAIAFWAAQPVAVAEVYRFVDNQGRTHFVESAEKVPEEYRSQAEKPAELPKINRSKSSPFVPAQFQKLRDARIEVLVTSWCPYCQKLEKFLKEKKIRYTRYDIDDSARGKDLHLSLGGGGVPVTKIGDTVIRGFDPAAIMNALEIK